jgi:predicted secreted protein
MIQLAGNWKGGRVTCGVGGFDVEENDDAVDACEADTRGGWLAKFGF